MRHRKHRPHQSRSASRRHQADRDKLTCCLRTLTRGQRYEEVAHKEPREEAHSETLKWMISAFQAEHTIQILRLNFSGKKHFLIWIFKKNRCVKKEGLFSPASIRYGVWLYMCVCVHAACLCVELWDKQFAPFTKCPAFMETAAYSKFHSWGFLRPDKLNLTVIRLISPFRSRYCLPGRAARQPYLCLQLPETKSFSSPVIFSLRPCTQKHSESQTSNARL